MKKLIILALAASALAACTPEQEQELVSYHHDAKADVCFATKPQFSTGQAWTDVECTPQVMLLAGAAAHLHPPAIHSIPTKGPAVWQIPGSDVCVVEMLLPGGERGITPTDCPQ